MGRFTPTRRENPCPICENISGKCREHRDGEIYLCMSFSDAGLGEIQNGHKCIKPANGGNWATFKLDNTEEWTQEQRLEWQQSNQQRRQLQAKEDSERRRRSLPAVERDKQYREILAQLSLHSDDREDLLRRGFTDEQIELCCFRSVERYHELQNQFSDLLPGLTGDGKRLVVSSPGYLCPVRDIDGLIVACQIRLRTLPTSESNRYRWLSGKGQTLHLYGDGLDGELPIGIFRPQGKPTGITLAEGTGAKPFLVSQRLNQIVIGAAGGQWASSEATFKHSLDQASLELGGCKDITLCPDAGDVTNPQVMNRWQKVTALLRKWGWSVKFGWWGQVDKTHPDIDELESEAIKFISPKNFWDIANHTKQQAQRDEKLRQERLKREAEDAIYQRLTTIQEKPWKVINTPKINLEELLTEPGAIYIVSSAKGTHKTNALVPVVASHHRVLAWFNRVALGREECNRIGLTWKDDGLFYGKKNKRGFCADSSFQFDPKILSEKGFLLGDECDQVFAHIFGSTCNKDGKRPLILATLEAHIDTAIHGGGMALFMSADVTQREIDYLKALAPEGCPVRLIVNEYKPDRGIVYFDISSNPDGKIEELLMALEEGTPCFLIDDIKNGVRGCKSIAEYVRSVHPEWASKIIEINSDTSGDPFIIEYLKNINEASKETLLLSCSPSVVSGISIENGHFGGVFALLNGILTVSDASQAIARVRGASEIHLWAAEEGLAYEANRSTDPDEIKDWYRRNYEANCKHLLSFRAEYEPITGEWGSPHFDLFCKNAAYRNLCMSRLRERLEVRLEEEGYHLVVEEDASSDMVKNALKDCWNKIELAEARAIAAANLLSDTELEALQYRTTPLDPEEKRDLQKTLLFKWFGQELIEATTYEHDSGEILKGYAAMALKNERGVYRKQLENFYLLTSDEGEAIGKDIAAETSQLKHNRGRFPGDIRWRSRQRKARAWLGLPEFLNPQKWYEPSDYRAMGEKAKSKAPMIKDCLNFTVENISDGQIFGELMHQLGLELDKVWAAVKPGQRRFKRRRISADSWRYAEMYVKYQQQLKADREASLQLAQQAMCQSEHPPQNIYTDPSFKGGVITEESQVEVCDSECANLNTPPRIYIQPSFLGGGDQDLSQGDRLTLDAAAVKTEFKPLVEALESQAGVCDSECASLNTPPSIYIQSSFLGGGDQDLSQDSEVQELLQALPSVETLEDFALVVEDSPLEAIEDAIALESDQARRQQLTQWLEGLSLAAAVSSKAAAYTLGQPVKVKLAGWANWLDGKISQIFEGVGVNLRVLITQECFLQSEEVGVFDSAVIAPA